MREIKFRAKGVDGKWWYGELDVLPLHEYRHVHLSNFFDLLRAKQLDLKTLGQYIGLKDKNGVEIYEETKN